MASGLFQPDGNVFPYLAGLPETVEQDDRWIVGAADIIGFEPDASKTFEFPDISHRHARSIDITAIVIRDMQTSFPASSSMRIDQI